MFTNVPFEKTKAIIREYYHLVQEWPSMDCELFLDCVSFFVEDTAFFTFDGIVYLQMGGLAMGNSLSQVLAEITTSYYLNKALLEFSNGEVTFIYKYVDDLIAAIDVDCLKDVQRVIESLLGMKMKLEVEDENKEVEYLQLKIGRSSNSRMLHVRWIQKEYSAKKIIDYYSYHPREMKNNVVREFIRSALTLTSPVHWKQTTNVLRLTLKRSNYPNGIVENEIESVKGSLLGINTNVRNENS